MILIKIRTFTKNDMFYVIFQHKSINLLQKNRFTKSTEENFIYSQLNLKQMENQPVTNNQEELITDFSSFFKKGGKIPKKPKLGNNNNTAPKTPNWLLQIPAKHDITLKDLEQRRYMDNRRWNSIVKTKSDSSFDKMMSSIISTWNYLFTINKSENTELLTMKKVEELLKQQLKDKNKQISEDNGREKTIFWLQKLMTITGKKTKNEIIMSFNTELSEEQNEKNIQTNIQEYLKGLQNQSASFIYFTYDKQFLIGAGFQKTPLKPLQAYKKLEDIPKQDQQLWIINASVTKFQSPFVIKRWRDIKTNLKTAWPNYLDIKKSKQGIKKRSEQEIQSQKLKKGNGWFIMKIQKLD